MFGPSLLVFYKGPCTTARSGVTADAVGCAVQSSCNKALLLHVAHDQLIIVHSCPAVNGERLANTSFSDAWPFQHSRSMTSQALWQTERCLLSTTRPRVCFTLPKYAFAVQYNMGTFKINEKWKRHHSSTFTWVFSSSSLSSLYQYFFAIKWSIFWALFQIHELPTTYRVTPAYIWQ